MEIIIRKLDSNTNKKSTNKVSNEPTLYYESSLKLKINIGLKYNKLRTFLWISAVVLIFKQIFIKWKSKKEKPYLVHTFY